MKQQYVTLKGPEPGLIAAVIDRARGDMPLYRFAYKCGMGAKTIMSVRSCAGKNNIAQKWIEAIVENSEGRVSLDRAMAANGMLNTKYLHALAVRERKKLWQSMQEKKTGSPKKTSRLDEITYFSEGGITQEVYHATETDRSSVCMDYPEEDYSENVYIPEITDSEDDEAVRYAQFMDDLSFLAAEMTPAQVRFIEMNIRRLFEDKAFGFILRHYCMLLEEARVDKLQKESEYMSGDQRDAVPKRDNRIAEIITKVRDEIFETEPEGYENQKNLEEKEKE